MIKNKLKKYIDIVVNYAYNNACTLGWAISSSAFHRTLEFFPNRVVRDATNVWFTSVNSIEVDTSLFQNEKPLEERHDRKLKPLGDKW